MHEDYGAIVVGIILNSRPEDTDKQEAALFEQIKQNRSLWDLNKFNQCPVEQIGNLTLFKDLPKDL